ncbi:MAG: sialate O-acetylesterase [Phycisphaerae bacterium]|nr:sialate O-acetylesterase [Phycisphaerae bacterium]
MNNPILRVVAVAASTFCSVVSAQLRLPSVFGDHMVLQRDVSTPIWGWATPGERVIVQINNDTRSASADAEGRWRIDMPAMKAGGPLELTITSGIDTRTLTDVLVGEVWLCSGQSNMEWPVNRADNGDAAITGPHDDQLRLFEVENAHADELQDDVKATWRRDESDSVGPFSAVAYFMGQRLRDELDVPVGLIHASYGGSPAEAWVPWDTLTSNEAISDIATELERKQKAHEEAMRKWERDSADAKRSGRYAPAKPVAPYSNWEAGYKPTVLWNAMLRPMAPFAVRGAVWYQGESNVGRAEQYRPLMHALIADWRDVFENEDMPFGIVQLANYADPYTNGGSWPELRESQSMIAAEDPNAGLVVTIDVGNPVDIHPTDKTTVGHRLAQWALGAVYDHDVATNGPTLAEMTISNPKITLRFDNVAGGLKTSDGKPPRGFAVQGESGGWMWAEAEIVSNDTIVVQGRWFPTLKAVHYAWDNNPDWSNLVNSEGLPAEPFRTEGPAFPGR